MTMDTSLDLPKFYSQARAQFAVRHKTSGQLLGYALLLPEVDVKDSLVKLVPWHDDDFHTTDAALAGSQDKSSVSHSSLHNLNQNLSMGSESEESSLNNTLTSQCTSDLPFCQADFTASLSLAKLSTSTPPEQMSSPVVTGSSSVKSVSSSKVGLPSGKSSSSSFTLPTVLSSVSEDIVDKCSEIQEETPVKRKNSDLNDRDFDCKFKAIKLDKNENPRVEFEDKFLPGGGVGKYDVFVKEVNPELKPKDIKMKKVTCLLCGDGKVMSYGNMGRHIKRFHEPPVICEICHKEFNGIQIEEHMARWHKEEVKEKCSDNRKSGLNKLNNLKLRTEVFSSVMPPLEPSTEVLIKSNILPANLDQPNKVSSGVSSLDPVLHPSSQDQVDLLTKDYIALTMTSATDKGIFLKMGLEKGAKVKKAMKKFGNKFNTEYRSLKFFLKNTQLSGEEVVSDLEGSEISVFGDLIN